MKQSFLSNLMGRNTYNEYKRYARIIVPIGTIILVVLFALTNIVHWSFLCSTLGLFMGTSLIFIAYLLSLILLLDLDLNTEMPEDNYQNSPKIANEPFDYKLSVVWLGVLIALSIVAIFFSNKYLHTYSFECNTFLVDEQAEIFHLDCDNNCEYAAEATHLVKMRGYEIKKHTNCSLCVSCKEWAEYWDDESYRYLTRY